MNKKNDNQLLTTHRFVNFTFINSFKKKFLNTYLDSLNDAQKRAVLQKDGPMIIIAGAGSGKTRVLTYRIAHLMQQGNRCL